MNITIRVIIILVKGANILQDINNDNIEITK